MIRIDVTPDNWDAQSCDLLELVIMTVQAYTEEHGLPEGAIEVVARKLPQEVPA